jgi:hypothetical protein
MASYVLILSLLLGNGKTQTVSHQNFLSEAACQQAGQAYLAEHPEQKLSYRCYLSEPEVTDPNLDENGNPIK